MAAGELTWRPRCFFFIIHYLSSDLLAIPNLVYHNIHCVFCPLVTQTLVVGIYVYPALWSPEPKEANYVLSFVRNVALAANAPRA